MPMPILKYEDFVGALLNAGFSMGGGNDEGIYAAVPWNWNEEPPYATPVRWHTGNMETDPWEWRMRVLDERNDIAYAKVFFKKSGYITKEWYPFFIAARRTSAFEDAYQEGTISRHAKRIYDVLARQEPLPVHVMKELAGFAKEEKAVFERALVELQMKMYVTMCGRQAKISPKGQEYGWSSTVFCTVESFFEPEVMEKAAQLDKAEAVAQIKAQIKKINPAAAEKKIIKFIQG